MASVLMRFSMSPASIPMASSPLAKVLLCMVAMESSRTMALEALAATSGAAPRLRKVEPSAAACW
ncbi:hypothetical protein D3C85_1576110 [compost metagenome]